MLEKTAMELVFSLINGYRVLDFDKNLCSHGMIVGGKLISRARRLKLFARQLR